MSGRYAVDFEFIPPSLPTLTFLMPPLFPSLSFLPKQFCFYMHTIPHRAFDVPMKPGAHE